MTKTTFIIVRVTADLKDSFKKKALKSNVTISDLIRDILQEHI